ncbi:hypothetical protein Ddye_021228 [Dipteronia dyeriana]|uniref:Reverse transcriptase zinc-binding domain-containing protein n=1 Tax=Dipteronia dyeriana TaxID=168575 RepID=A0AAD9U1P1_9ROSI|nr:hypothetical protein Ddye_021228 [Dipteronia dyeriana]
MSLFRLPKGLVYELHKLCIRFWWGSSDENCKLHWCSWKKPCHTKVSVLKPPTSEWNEELIRASFFPSDADLILSLPCSTPSMADSVMWHYEKLGFFSVKSGYLFRNNVWSNPNYSGLNSAVSWWKFLWRMKIPSKVKALAMKRGLQLAHHALSNLMVVNLVKVPGMMVSHVSKLGC